MLYSKPQPDDLLLTSDAARQLEISGQMVIRLESTGKLAAIRTTNGTRLFRRSDVEKLKEERDQKRKS